jgi:3-hydroxyisobutyrate dehydrogenase
VLGEKLGLSHQAMFDVVSASSGQCWSLTNYSPVPGVVPTSPANNGYKAGFTAALMLKDLKLAKAAADSVKAETAIGAHAAQIYERYAQESDTALDFSAIINLVRAHSGG